MTQRDDRERMTQEPADQLLDAFFVAARAQSAEPGDDFLARIMGDATAVQAGFADADGDVAPTRLSLWAALRDAVGGWAPAGALAASVAIGFWVGYGDPTGLAAQAGLFGSAQTTETVDIFTALDDFGVEG